MLFAHHSVNFYEEAVTRVAGELVEVQWRNPHVGLTIEAVNDRGVSEIWQMETSSIYPLERAGITRDILSVGRQIVIIGRRSTREVSKMLALRAQHLPCLERARGQHVRSRRAARRSAIYAERDRCPCVLGYARQFRDPV